MLELMASFPTWAQFPGAGQGGVVRTAVEEQGMREEGMGRRAGQEEAVTSGLFAVILKLREIGSLFR